MISRSAFGSFRDRSRRITCFSSNNSGSAIAIAAERFIGLSGKASYPVKEKIVATQDTAVATKEERTVSFQRSIYDPGYVNAMSHFYRGEMGRIMVWRQRLDVTTNWAITSSTAIITIAFTTREVPHIIFFFNLAIVWVLLWIEARRYRFYDAFRARVRMLEAHFLVPMVMENRQMLQGEWKKLVCEDLSCPCFRISKLEAVGRRLKRNYVFIFVLILVAWLTKIFLHATAPINDIVSFYHALRIGHIPSWLVALVFAGTFVSVIAITIYVSKRSSGEISEFGTHRSVRRHPHVFGASDARDAGAVLKQWEAIKREEKKADSHYLASLPKALPALMRAHKAQSKAARVNFDWTEAREVIAKVEEEVREMKDAIEVQDGEMIADEIGDVLFAVVNLARKCKIDAESALQKATDKFVERFNRLEDELRRQDKRLGDVDLEEMDAIWERIKNDEARMTNVEGMTK